MDPADRIAQLEAELAKSRAETRHAFETRAYMYAYIYESMAQDLGTEQATQLMKRAIYRRGVEVGEKYREAASDGDMAMVGNIFCSGSPCDGALFEPGVETLEDGRVQLRMTACPLVDTWREMGLPADLVDHLCEIAAAVDEGTFAGAGLDLEFLSRLGKDGDGRCLLDLTLPDTELE
jgi:hypothetical protein